MTDRPPLKAPNTFMVLRTNERVIDIECSCASELLRLSWWPDDDQLFLSMWEARQAKKFSFFSWQHRLRMIWRILRVGHPYADDLVLDHEAVDRLRQALDVAVAEMGRTG